MAGRKRKSKKRSVASSRRQPESFVLFLDRNLGRYQIAQRLRDAGAAVEIHDDHLAPDAPDEEWIDLVSRNDWIAITKDKNIRYRYAQWSAFAQTKARVLVIRAKNVTGSEIAEILAKNIARIQRFSRKNSPPFVAGMDRSGTISSYKLAGDYEG